jgi:hypothetical protein
MKKQLQLSEQAEQWVQDLPSRWRNPDTAFF